MVVKGALLQGRRDQTLTTTSDRRRDGETGPKKRSQLLVFWSSSRAAGQGGESSRRTWGSCRSFECFPRPPRDEGKKGREEGPIRGMREWSGAGRPLERKKRKKKAKRSRRITEAKKVVIRRAMPGRQYNQRGLRPWRRGNKERKIQKRIAAGKLTRK